MIKPIEYLDEAEKITRAVDHLIYITFTLVKDKKILIKSLTEIKKAIAYSINAILQYEYLIKKITIYKDPELNFKTFIQKCAKDYELTPEEIKKIQEIFLLIKNHKQSSMEFTRNEKLVIITDWETKTVNIEKIKEFLSLSKKLIQNTRNKILEKYKKT